MNYEDMSYFEINKAVAFKIRGREAVSVVDTSLSKLVRIFNGNSKHEEESGWVDFDPCNNPSDAWFIIVENEISIEFLDGGYVEVKLEAEFGTFCPDDTYLKERAFVAAMICFLKMKDAEK